MQMQERQLPATVELRSQMFMEFIETVESTKACFLIESHLACQNNLLVVGASGSGKSWLLDFAL